MNGRRRDLTEVRQLGKTLAATQAEVLICPPATLLAPMAEIAKATSLRVGGQDCHALEQGAHTGDISAEMIKNTGASYVIVGHSERRSDHGEQDRDVAAKVSAAYRAGLTAIMCLGETVDERKKGLTLRVIGRQLRNSLPEGVNAKNTVIAYEPIWAIGTGLTPTLQEITSAHAHLRRSLVRKYGPQGQKIRLLYGGSVKPDNAAEILALDNVDGALVGGASLKARDFAAIIKALP